MASSVMRAHLSKAVTGRETNKVLLPAVSPKANQEASTAAETAPAPASATSSEQGDFQIKASHAPAPQLSTEQDLALECAAHCKEEPHPGGEVSLQLVVRPDGSVKVLLLTGPTTPGEKQSANSNASSLLYRQSTPAPIDIPLVNTADVAGGDGRGKSALAWFFTRERKANDNQPQSMQAVKARRSFSAQFSRSMRNLSRSIRRSMQRKDSPPIPLGRHISNRRPNHPESAPLDAVVEEPALEVVPEACGESAGGQGRGSSLGADHSGAGQH